MAINDFVLSDPCGVKAINAVSSGVVLPTNGWHIEVLQLPFTTSVEEIQTLFTKYGTIDSVAIIHKIKDKSLICYISYEKESDSSEALRENGKKVGTSSITVIKYETSGNVDKGNKRLRTDDTSNGWGAITTTNQSNDWGSATTTSSTNNSGGWGSTDTAPSDSWGGGGCSSPSGASRGRGRGRGGASGGGRACFKCGEEGHMSRECPKGGGGGGGSRACFKCGEEGHMSRECPKNGGGGGGGSRACFKCGEEGHMSRECPKGGGRACFNCNEEGHMSRECTKPRSGRGRGRGGGGNFGDRGNSSNSGASEWGSSASTTTPSVTDSSWD